MNDFAASRWADRDFARAFRNEADSYIPFRHRVIEITLSLYQHLSGGNPGSKVLDLGCGDGFFISALLAAEKRPVAAVLVDGSAGMLDAARQRLAGRDGAIDFRRASFQELLVEDRLDHDFDLVFSSLAIHHLGLEEKIDLYRFIYDHLRPGGQFFNFDAVLSPTEDLEKCYLALWAAWIRQHPGPADRDRQLPVPEQYKANPDNSPDTLKVQLAALDEIGFEAVDCPFKYGIFALFGGMKPTIQGG